MREDIALLEEWLASGELFVLYTRKRSDFSDYDTSDVFGNFQELE
jgi:hypothetical protein